MKHLVKYQLLVDYKTFSCPNKVFTERLCNVIQYFALGNKKNICLHAQNIYKLTLKVYNLQTDENFL